MECMVCKRYIIVTTHFKPPCMFFSHGLRMQIFSEFVKLDGQKFARVMYTYILDEKYTFLVIIFISNRIRRSICAKKCSKMVNFDEKKSSFMKCHTLRNRQSPTKQFWTKLYEVLMYRQFQWCITQPRICKIAWFQINQMSTDGQIIFYTNLRKIVISGQIF